MKSLIINKDNYADVGGKSYAVDTFGCNYPVRQNGTTLSITCTNGSNIITSTDDLTELLGCDIQNNNIPLYKWLASFLPAIIEIRNINNANEAVLTHEFAGASGTYDFSTIDIFGQPTVQDTLLIDSASGGGWVPSISFYTKNGSTMVAMGGDIAVQSGSDPILVDFTTDFQNYAMNIKYE